MISGVLDMSSRLEQAMKRLDQAVIALEQMPKTAKAPEESPQKIDAKLNQEIAEIRGLVDEAMAALSQDATQEGEGKSS